MNWCGGLLAAWVSFPLRAAAITDIAIADPIAGKKNPTGCEFATFPRVSKTKRKKSRGCGLRLRTHSRERRCAAARYRRAVSQAW
jgi:hypothetical protein